MNNIGSHPNNENREYWIKGCSPAARRPSRGTAGQITVQGIPLIEAAAGRPSGRRPFIANGGLGAVCPHHLFSDFHGKTFQKRSERFMKVTPSLLLKIFHMGPHPRPFTSKASPDEAASARGPIAIESRRGVKISHENHHRLRFQIFYMTLAMPAATPAQAPPWRPQFLFFMKCPTRVCPSRESCIESPQKRYRTRKP